MVSTRFAAHARRTTRAGPASSTAGSIISPARRTNPPEVRITSLYAIPVGADGLSDRRFGTDDHHSSNATAATKNTLDTTSALRNAARSRPAHAVATAVSSTATTVIAAY